MIVAAHAGGRCDRFDRPADLSSCDSESEIFQLARSLPHGLVDVIVAGHTHAGLAHQVDGIGIIQPFSRGQSFGRVDVVFDRRTRRSRGSSSFRRGRSAPNRIPRPGTVSPRPDRESPAEYEGRAVTADPAIIHAMEPALQRVRELQATPLGVSLERPDSSSRRRLGSPLGNLFAEALRDAVPGADVAAINNAGRLWADLPDGPITFGQLYDVFPFDNRLVRVTLSGAELARWVASRDPARPSRHARHFRRRRAGECLADGVHVDLLRGARRRIDDNDRLLAVTIGAPTLNGNLASPDFLGGVGPIENNPVVREVVEDWFRKLGRLTPGERDRIFAPARPLLARTRPPPFDECVGRCDTVC